MTEFPYLTGAECMNGVLKDKKAFAVFLLPGLLFYLFSVFYPIVDSIRLSTMKSEHLNLSVLEITQSCLEIRCFIRHF